MDIIDVLGLDRKDFVWQDLAACEGMDTRLFFEYYEEDPVIARQIDELCDGCPIKQQCLLNGLENREVGVRAGVYLDGKGGIDKSKLGHKPKDEQERLKAL
jgi:hypothetical protein